MNKYLAFRQKDLPLQAFSREEEEVIIINF
jgi:hypothetical protein